MRPDMPRLFSRPSILLGILLVAVGIAAAFGATAYPLGSARNMGPGYVPLALGGIITVLGVLIFLRGLRESEAIEDLRVYLAPLGLVTAGLIFFGLVVDRGGLALAAFGAALIASRATQMDWLRGIICAALLSMILCTVFVLLLRVPIPLWPR